MHKRTIRLLVLFLTLQVGLISAQSRGTITGRITDGSVFLPGANVVIEGTNHGATSNDVGMFRIFNIEEGTVTIKIYYIGFESVERTVSIKAGEVTEIGNIQLNVADDQLNEVVVKGTMAPSQRKAIMIKKSSTQIMDVLASDAIGKLPDRNAAEAVQRLPAVSVNRYHGEANQVSVRGTPYAWSSTLYNGTRLPSANVFGERSTPLDAIPSEMVQYVQLSKSLTPDMEGDAIGGSINFITRTAPEKKMLNVSLAGGYNERSQNGTYNGSIVWGDRFANDKLGIVVSASIWERNWAADELAMEYNINLPNPEERYSINTMNAKRYIGTRRTTAINAAAEYEFNGRNKIYTRLVRDQFDDIRPVYESYYEFDRNRYRYSNRYSDYQTNLDGVELGGIHQLTPKLKMDWRYSRYDMRYALETPPNMPADQKGLPIAQFFQPLQGGFEETSGDGRMYTNFDAPDGRGVNLSNPNLTLTNPADFMDAERLMLQQLIIYQIDQRETDNVQEVNFSYEANQRLNFKVGGKFRQKAVEGMFTPLVFLPNAILGIPNSAPPQFLTDFDRMPFPIAGGLFNELGNPFNNFIMDPVTTEQLFDIFSPEYFEENDIGDYSPASNVTTRYNGREDVYAGYAMFSYKINEKTTFTGGVRNEFTAIEMNSGQYDVETGETAPLQRNSSYNAFLPMGNLKYSMNKNSNLRAAYSRSFARANFPDLNPGENVDVTGGFPRITRGNVELRPTFSDNFDLMGEYYFSNIGLISAGAFYKNINDLIFRDLSQQTIDGVDYLISQPNNIESSYLVGFETGITKRFSELPGFWGGFGVDGNYTMIHSEARVPRIDENGETQIDITGLPHQSRHLYNASVFYERKGVMMRLAANYRGPSVGTINQDLGPDFYVYIDKNLTVDLSAAYAFSEKLRFFAEIRNLTNEPFVQYLGEDRRRITSSEWFSISGQIGIRYILY